MGTVRKNQSRGFRSERGQTTLVVILVLGIFLLGFVALAVDFSNLWFHRQTAQSAADSACMAAAMDMLLKATGGTTSMDTQINAGSTFNCSGNMSLAPCQYAKINGYDATGGLTTGSESREVQISFPTGFPGVTLESGVTTLAGPHPYVRADVTDRSRVFFSSLFTQRLTQDVVASAGCGLLLAKAPIPLIVLHPTCAHSFEISGSGSLAIVGGPTKSVQVNSSNQTCAAATGSTQCSGNGTVDLSQGGPDFTGSRFGVNGQPWAAPSSGSFLPGTTGSWGHGTPIKDPYALTPAPDPVALGLPTNPSPTFVKYTDPQNYGCPDHTIQTGSPGPATGWSCEVFWPGVYTQPIQVKQLTALFMPGVYIIQPTSYPGSSSGGGLCGSPSSCTAKPTGQCLAELLVDSSGVVRPGIPAGGTGKEGAMLYMSGGAGGYANAVFTSNAGTSGGRTIDPFITDRMICPGGTAPSQKVGIPPKVDGNVLMGECTAGGTYIAHNGAGSARGLVTFQDHANLNNKGQLNMQGGGGLLIAGTLYSHASDNSAFIQLQGNPGSGTYLFGEIVTDQFVLAGNGAVAMQLSPDAVLDILKVQLLQ